MIRLYTVSFILILLSSCGKDKDIFIQQSNQIYIDQLFSELVLPSQTYTFFGDNPTVNYLTEEGILLSIDPSKILKSDGNQSLGQNTLSVEVLNESKEVFFNQLSTEVDGHLFNPEVALRFTFTDSEGNLLQTKNGAVKCYIPGQFDDSAHITLYRHAMTNWEESSEQSILRIGNFEVENSEATIWSGFGYTFYAESDTWYTVTSEWSQATVGNNQLCIESSYDYTDTRVFLVNKMNNTAVLVSYSTIMNQFCESWTSRLDENRYMLYVVSAYNESDYGLSILDIQDLTDKNEISLPADGEKLDKETMLSLLSE